MGQNGFAIPEHTQTPNSFFDVTLPQIKSIGELKVLLAIMRQTFGWRKFTDTISLSQLVKITGLSRQGVMNGLQLALEHGHIERTPHGQSFTYGLKLLVKQVDQSSKLTSQEDRPEVVKQVDQQLVKQVDTQKKGIKERKESVAHKGNGNGKDPLLSNPLVVEYRNVCHNTPNAQQRADIAAAVKDKTVWSEVLTQLMREGRPPQRVDWALERYQKAVAKPRALSGPELEEMLNG